MADWRALASVCFSTQNDLFQYTLCPFRNMTQRHVVTDQVVLLGVFDVRITRLDFPHPCLVDQSHQIHRMFDILTLRIGHYPQKAISG